MRTGLLFAENKGNKGYYEINGKIIAPSIISTAKARTKILIHILFSGFFVELFIVSPLSDDFSCVCVCWAYNRRISRFSFCSRKRIFFGRVLQLYGLNCDFCPLSMIFP